MPGPPERSPSEVVREFFDAGGPEPSTASEVADETGYPLRTVRTELDKLVERGLLQTKEVGQEQVWWSSPREREADVRPESDFTPTDATTGQRADATTDQHADATTDQQSGPSRQWLMKNHRQLAQLVTRINITDDLDELLHLITEEARELIGAHQSVTSRTVNQDWEQAINAVSLSEKYAEYRDYDTEPDGSGIYALVCERNESMRMTQSELESHPAWNAFGDDADEHPPMRGWLAVPIVGSEGQNMGLIQVSDKYRGEFTRADEAVLVQLANVASAAIENARLYDELRESEERYRTLFESMTEGYCVIEEVDTAPGEPMDFRYVETNPAFEDHAGLRDVVGATIRERSPGEPNEWLDVFESVVRTGDEVTFQRELDPDGRVLQCQAFPIGEPSSERVEETSSERVEETPNRQVGVLVRDITERVERERKLEASNQRLESFASMLAHELRNPVAIGQIYSRQLPEETTSEAVEYVTEAFDRIEDMIDVMLVLTQGRNAIDQSEALSLAETAREAWDEVDTPEATLEIDVDARIETDGTYIRHLFRNLFENAVEHGSTSPRSQAHEDAVEHGSTSSRREADDAVEHGGSDVTVRVGEMEDGFFVADDGVGIPADERDAVFEAGMTTAADKGGTGLGLAFVQELATVYGWSCSVTESASGGARFEFTDVDFLD